MPISEDEIECKSQEPQSTMSKAELRKTHKPIMEKRRRARINQCLNEIKTLILEAMNKDPSRHSKLEKADILEMAVKHLQNVQRQQLAMAMATDPSVLRKFKTGFNECASEIDRYMGQIDGVDNTMKQRVSSHLMKCIGGIEQVAQFNFPGFSNAPFLNDNNVFTTTTPVEASTGDQNNNARIQIPQGIHLIPSRLPNGELALLVPNSSKLPYFPTAVTTTIQRPSAFAAVVPQSSETISKPLSPPMSPEVLRSRNPSPHGFRPVVSINKNFIEDHQVPQISSTVTSDQHKFSQPLEVKTMKYPIQRKLDSPKTSGEPLCIITNQAERYKQAQMKEDSSSYAENIVQSVKRKAEGLLTIAPPPKIIKTHLVTPTTSFVRKEDTFESSRHSPGSQILDRNVPTRRDEPSGSRDSNVDSGNDMWRPW